MEVYVGLDGSAFRGGQDDSPSESSRRPGRVRCVAGCRNHEAEHREPKDPHIQQRGMDDEEHARLNRHNGLIKT